MSFDDACHGRNVVDEKRTQAQVEITDAKRTQAQVEITTTQS